MARGVFLSPSSHILPQVTYRRRRGCPHWRLGGQTWSKSEFGKHLWSEAMSGRVSGGVTVGLCLGTLRPKASHGTHVAPITSLPQLLILLLTQMLQPHRPPCWWPCRVPLISGPLRWPLPLPGVPFPRHLHDSPTAPSQGGVPGPLQKTTPQSLSNPNATLFLLMAALSHLIHNSYNSYLLSLFPD